MPKPSCEGDRLKNTKNNDLLLFAFMGFTAVVVQRGPDIGSTFLAAASGDSHGNALAGKLSGF